MLSFMWVEGAKSESPASQASSLKQWAGFLLPCAIPPDSTLVRWHF